MLGLAVIPYSISIGDFLNSQNMNSYPWSYVISVGLGYLVNRVASTKFYIDIAI